MFVQTLKLILYINVWFIHILRRQTAFLFHTDAIIERSYLRRDIVGTERELYTRGFAAESATLWDGWDIWSTRHSVLDVFLLRSPRHKLPLAYLREYSLVLHLQLLFQGGVKFPTGGKSGGVKGAPWRRRDACDRADESATRVCVGSHAG